MNAIVLNQVYQYLNSNHICCFIGTPPEHHADFISTLSNRLDRNGFLRINLNLDTEVNQNNSRSASTQGWYATFFNLTLEQLQRSSFTVTPQQRREIRNLSPSLENKSNPFDGFYNILENLTQTQQRSLLLHFTQLHCLEDAVSNLSEQDVRFFLEAIDTYCSRFLTPSESNLIADRADPSPPGLYFFFEQATSLENQGDYARIPTLIWNGQAYIFQEYDGQNLAQELKESGPFGEKKIWQILEELLPQLQALHEDNVIHQNIKPEKIIRRRADGRLVLQGLGTASVTPSPYTAPELLRGRSECASDLYSLGATCLYLMTRTSPFQLYSDRLGEWVWRDHLPSGQRISPRLGEILDRLVAHPLGQRFASAQDVLTAIHQPAPPPPPPKEPKRPEPSQYEPPVAADYYRFPEPEPRRPHPRRPIQEPEPKSPLNINLKPNEPVSKPTSKGKTSQTSAPPIRSLWIITTLILLAPSVWFWSREYVPPNVTPTETVTTPPDPNSTPTQTFLGLPVQTYRYTSARVSPQGNVTPYEATSPVGKYTETALNLPTGAVPLEMVAIPGGTFTMGSPDTEVNRDSDEGPQHEVTVPDFFMGQYEVTQAQYAAVMGNNPANFKGDNNPVENVSWDDAQTFIQRLNSLTGKTYRLPTEAEWEYAARAGTTTPFSYGETITPEVVNYDGNSPYGGAPKGESRQRTIAVDSLYPNPWGLYHIHGNVWEWVEDGWHDNYNGAPTDGTAWLSSDELRLLRGGSWDYYAGSSRSANRDRNGRDSRIVNRGFRLVFSGRTP